MKITFSREKKKHLTLLPISINETYKENIKKDLDKLFSDPNLFFSNKINGKEVIIGKKFSNMIYHNNIPLLSKKSPKRLTSKKKAGKNLSSISHNSITKKTENSFFYHVHKKEIDNESLERIYDNFKKIQNINSSKSFSKKNNLMNSITQIEMNKKIKSQEKALKQYNDDNKGRNKLIKRILKKTKKNKNNILINSIDDFRIKQEYNNLIENERLNNNQKALFKWQRSLRFSESFNDNYYIDVGIKKPIWLLVKNKSKDNDECIRNPSFDISNSNSINNYSYQHNNLYENKTFINQSNLFGNSISNKNLLSLRVKGENLLSFEMNNSKLLKGRKILRLNENGYDDKKEYLISDYNNK